MASMTCRHFHEELERWMDGERSPAALAHVKSCSACSGIIADLKAIESQAHSWSAPLAEPPERVWVLLRAQLESEGIIKVDSPEPMQIPAGSSWWSTIFAGVPRPVLAGAYLAALVFLAFRMPGPEKRPTVVNWLSANNEVATSPLRAQLNTAEMNNVSALRAGSSPVAASLHQNLDIVDKQIALCEKSVSEEPDNEVARDFLYEAYQQKADLLAEISERGESGQ
jgi:hypothetical protein